MPKDGIYRIQIGAPAHQRTSRDNYRLSVWDATVDEAPLVFHQTVNGFVDTVDSVDRWTFSALANQQVQFDHVGTYFER